MQRLTVSLALVLALAQAAAAAEMPASEQSINELLAVSGTHAMRDKTVAQVDAMMHEAMTQATAGQALIAKMPVIMQNTMAAMQERMKTIMPRVQQLVHDSTEKLQAAATRPAAPTGP
jgi:hypothetical protein